jgi:hypothetical protein
VRADEELTAFVELKFAVSGSRRFASTSWQDFSETRRRLSGPESDEGHFSARLLCVPDLQSQNQPAALLQIYSKF